jgi:hypothetical protein
MSTATGTNTTGVATVQLLSGNGWTTACPLDLLESGRGVAVLLPGCTRSAT